ncbi:hypothetical protein CUT44_14285 [Streptomyces carminius]|uniref:DUF7739 domain-containing protein n=1 Tax=Streptomyces carminius TaxID=2665496 RepID=A0A2M8LYY5_9ACTN|nr:hypothetical protein [Streptomyces carminius]PJE97145.1 hypothetical protein CUT44_14285 [Streptomyces carminius]
MGTHVTVSHGSDFFGVDTIAVQQLRELGQYARSVLSADDHPLLTTLLDDAGQCEHTLDADQAALLAILLRRIAARRRLKKPVRDLATRLGIAAANAAADSAPWVWTIGTEGIR